MNEHLKIPLIKLGENRPAIVCRSFGFNRSQIFSEDITRELYMTPEAISFPHDERSLDPDKCKTIGCYKTNSIQKL